MGIPKVPVGALPELVVVIAFAREGGQSGAGAEGAPIPQIVVVPGL
jgi:hypothetical protein